LLRIGERIDWALEVEQIAIDVVRASSDASANIVPMFAGMGSLNDIVT